MYLELLIAVAESVDVAPMFWPPQPLAAEVDPLARSEVTPPARLRPPTVSPAAETDAA